MSLGLCLSGGGIKAAAHIGILKAFEEKNVEIDAISGTSSGSIVATLHACGYNADEILKIFRKYAEKIRYVDWKNIFKLIAGILLKGGIKIKGLTSRKKNRKIIKKVLY